MVTYGDLKKYIKNDDIDKIRMIDPTELFLNRSVPYLIRYCVSYGAIRVMRHLASFLDRYDGSVLYEILKHNQHEEYLKIILNPDSGIDVNTCTDYTGNTLLHDALAIYPDKVPYILSIPGLDLFRTNFYGDMPINIIRRGTPLYDRYYKIVRDMMDKHVYELEIC